MFGIELCMQNGRQIFGVPFETTKGPLHSPEFGELMALKRLTLTVCLTQGSYQIAIGAHCYYV